MDANKCQNIEGVSQLTKKILTKYIPLNKYSSTKTIFKIL